ncbi:MULTISPECIES: lipopolysaccharide biosynthesis protein [unclassified Vibrio]|uniref:lipopolysaccharide biosynthesis protein n=2 Tax=Vibrio TaxID=662 RepID=UPI001E4BFE25|nr:hypothetical protein [Vibrio sp. F13]MCC4892271.1 hypothetical protein [Vibrio sp. F13]
MSRISNVIKNAKVGLFFMVITFALGMASRKLFLDELGPEFIGLTTTLLGIIGFLSLAEMGLSVAVSSTLYKPLAEKDYKTVNTTIDFLGKAYKLIGLSMVVLGSIVALFIPYFFPEQEIDLSVIYFAYVVFILSVVLEYVFNYRQIILSADQKSYVITCWRDGLNITKIILQIGALYVGLGEFAWLSIGVFTSSISIIFINRYVNKHYGWLQSTGKGLTRLYKDSSEIVTKTKQLVLHKTGDFVFRSSDSILIYKFSELSTVAMIGNATILSGAIKMLQSAATSGLTASVGNFVSNRSREDSFELYRVVRYLYFTIAVFVFFMFGRFVNDVIFIWLGSNYILPQEFVFIISLNLYFMISRGANDTFIQAYGLFSDTKAPLFEVIINLIASIAFGLYFGPVGVLFGTALSVFFIVIIWKSYFLCKKAFYLPWRSIAYSLISELVVVCIVYATLVDYGFYAFDNKIKWEEATYFILSGTFAFVVLLIGHSKVRNIMVTKIKRYKK